MGMLVARIDLQLGEHCTAQLVLWHHALHCFLNDHFRRLDQKLVKRDGLNASRVSSVMVVKLVCCFFTGYHDLFGVDNDDIVTRVNVRCEFWLMLASQAVRNLCTKSPQGLA